MSSTGKGIDLSVPLDETTRADLHARLWAQARPASDCLVWTGYRRNEQGHGAISVHNRPTWVHQLAYAIHHGPIEPGLVVRHRCDNPPCIEPEHLHLGTQGDNVRDIYARGRQSRRGRRITKGLR